MATNPKDRVTALGDGIARLAEQLYLLDTDAQVELLDDTSVYTGRTAEVVAAARGGVPELWQRYTALRETHQAMERALDANDWDTPTKLFEADGVELPDGTTVAPEELLANLLATATSIVEVSTQLATSWQDVIPRVDALKMDLFRLEQRAETQDGDEELLRQARSRLLDVQAKLVSDPLGIDLHACETAIAAVRADLDGRVAEREGLSRQLAEARRTLQDLRALIPAGTSALDDTRDLILRPTGLLTPLDPGLVDGDARSLGPWLERLEALVQSGDVRRAAAGLAQWRRQADAHHQHARRVHEANAGPLRRRDELRGLLDALRAKAAAAGFAETRSLSDLHDAAREVLFVAPCPLDLAATRVKEYQMALEDLIDG